MPQWRRKGTAVEKPEDLRRLAEWYRGMADIGHTGDCSSRRRFADYLERRAADLEQARVTSAGCAAGAYVSIRT
jgi:hypothetical protein